MVPPVNSGDQARAVHAARNQIRKLLRDHVVTENPLPSPQIDNAAAAETRAQPATETPVTATPVTATPVTETPVIETLVTEIPVIVTETLAKLAPENMTMSRKQTVGIRKSYSTYGSRTVLSLERKVEKFATG